MSSYVPSGYMSYQQLLSRVRSAIGQTNFSSERVYRLRSRQAFTEENYITCVDFLSNQETENIKSILYSPEESCGQNVQLSTVDVPLNADKMFFDFIDLRFDSFDGGNYNFTSSNLNNVLGASKVWTHNELQDLINLSIVQNIIRDGISTANIPSFFFYKNKQYNLPKEIWFSRYYWFNLMRADNVWLPIHYVDPSIPLVEDISAYIPQDKACYVCGPVWFEKEGVDKYISDCCIIPTLSKVEMDELDRQWLEYTQMNPHLRIMRAVVDHFGYEEIIAVGSNKQDIKNYIMDNLTKHIEYCKNKNNLNATIDQMAKVLRLPEQGDGKAYKGPKSRGIQKQ